MTQRAELEIVARARDEATATLQGFGRNLDMIVTRLAMVGAAAAAAGAIIGVKFAADLEQARIGFTTMLGSAEKAQEFLSQMQTFAAKTPFEFPELLDASRRLMAFGFAAEDVLPIMTAVGDAVAAMGGSSEQVQRVTMALGQMRTAGRVGAQDMLQLTSAGIKAWEYLADAIGKTVPEVRKMAEEGQIEANAAIQAILHGMQEDFKGAMDVQSRSFLGLISTMKDVSRDVLGRLMEPLLEQMSIGLQAVARFVETATFQQWADDTIEAFRGAFAFLTKEAIPVAIGAFAYARDLWVGMGEQVQKAVIGIGTAFAIARAIAMPEITAVAAGLAGLIYLSDLAAAALGSSFIETENGIVAVGEATDESRRKLEEYAAKGGTVGSIIGGIFDNLKAKGDDAASAMQKAMDEALTGTAPIADRIAATIGRVSDAAVALQDELAAAGVGGIDKFAAAAQKAEASAGAYQAALADVNAEGLTLIDIQKAAASGITDTSSAIGKAIAAHKAATEATTEYQKALADARAEGAKLSPDAAEKVAAAAKKAGDATASYRQALSSANIEGAKVPGIQAPAAAAILATGKATDKAAAAAKEAAKAQKELEDAIRGVMDIPIAGETAVSDQLFQMQQQAKQLELRILQMGGRGAAGIEPVEQELEALRRQMDVVRLQSEITFDPMRRMLDRLVDPVTELNLSQKLDAIFALDPKTIANLDAAARASGLTVRYLLTLQGFKFPDASGFVSNMTMIQNAAGQNVAQTGQMQQAEFAQTNPNLMSQWQEWSALRTQRGQPVEWAAFVEHLRAIGAPTPMQHGGLAAAGRPYLVGERGPELFVPRSSGDVVPNSALAGNDNRQVTVNIYGSGDPRGVLDRFASDPRVREHMRPRSRD